MPALRVVAALVVTDAGVLLVSKRAAPDVFYLPGGKPEPGESHTDCLHRELREELGVAPTRVRHFADVHAPAALEATDIEMAVHRAELDGAPAPAAEIASLLWWPPRDRVVTLAPAVRDHVLPRLGAVPPGSGATGGTRPHAGGAATLAHRPRAE